MILKALKPYSCLLLLPILLMGAELNIQPYTQWTFDTAIEQVVFLESGPGYPIYMIRTEKFIRIYDQRGEELRKIERQAWDRFYLNNARTGFMLVHEQEVLDSRRDETLSAFQVFTSKGERDYTAVHRSDFETGVLEYQLTDDRSIIITEHGKPWLLKQNAEDTLLYLSSVPSSFDPECKHLVLAVNLSNQGEMVTASSCIPADTLDEPVAQLKLW